MRLPWMLPAFGLAIALALQNPSPAWADFVPSHEEFGDCHGDVGDLCHRQEKTGICRPDGRFTICSITEEDQRLFALVMEQRRRTFLKNLAVVAAPITILALFIAFRVRRHRKTKKQWEAAVAEENRNEDARGVTQ